MLRRPLLAVLLGSTSASACASFTTTPKESAMPDAGNPDAGEVEEAGSVLPEDEAGMDAGMDAGPLPCGILWPIVSDTAALFDSDAGAGVCRLCSLGGFGDPSVRRQLPWQGAGQYVVSTRVRAATSHGVQFSTVFTLTDGTTSGGGSMATSGDYGDRSAVIASSKATADLFVSIAVQYANNGECIEFEPTATVFTPASR